ncbi:acyl-CoA carboxylase subunit epsilon [Streptomyces sp. NPDC047813]|uniref:acyl-CoA carboxylase subunit epsilon n=1 Tax=Streptomyces sp. NPDC047813 TaxID=3154608 RepID=UPI0033ED9C89
MKTATNTMYTPNTPNAVVRVERGGRITDDELAALTVVLLARAAGRRSTAARDDHAESAPPRWERLERHAFYRLPGSWRGGSETGR